MNIASHKAITILDVAREAGVSPRTVSRVVNGNDYVRQETYDRVQQVIHELGYRPSRAARSLVSDRSMVIGLAIPDLKNPYYTEVIGGVEYVAQEQGYNVLLFNAQGQPERERDIFRILEEHRADGVIFNTPRLPVDELTALLQRQKTAVIIGHDPIDDLAGIVNIDIASAMQQAVAHMLHTGHHNLAYVKPPDDHIYPHRQRLQGFLAALQQHQIPYNSDYMVECPGDWESSLQAIHERLQQHPEINGLICYHDLMAFGALEACDVLGLRVPDQVAVIGFDDITFSSLNRLSLTTFKIPRFEVGVQAARMLFDRMQGVQGISDIMIKTEFVQRNSTPVS